MFCYFLLLGTVNVEERGEQEQQTVSSNERCIWKVEEKNYGNT